MGWSDIMVSFVEGPILYLVLAICAMASVYGFATGDKRYIFWGLGSFFVVAIFTALGDALPTTWGGAFIAAAPPVFGELNPELSAFAYFSGTMRGFFMMGAEFCNLIMSSSLFRNLGIVIFVSAGLSIALQMASFGEHGLRRVVSYLILALIVFAIAFYPSVQFTNGSGADEALIQDRADAVKKYTIGDSVAPAGSVVPLYAGFMLEAARGIGEELAMALLGVNPQDRIDDMVGADTVVRAWKNARISKQAAEYYVAYGALCVPAVRRLQAITKGTEDHSYLQYLQLKVSEKMNAYVNNSGAARNNLLAPRSLTVMQYANVSQLLVLDDHRGHIKSFVEEAKKPAHMKDTYLTWWKFQYVAPTTAVDTWASASPTVSATPEREEGEEDAKNPKFTFSNIEGAMATSAVCTAASVGGLFGATFGGGEISFLPDPVLYRLWGNEGGVFNSGTRREIHCMVAYEENWGGANGAKALMNWSDSDGYRLSEGGNGFAPHTYSIPSAKIHYANLVNKTETQLQGMTVNDPLPSAGYSAWHSTVMPASGRVVNYDASLLPVAAIVKNFNNDSCQQAKDDGPTHSKWLGCYLRDVHTMQTDVGGEIELDHLEPMAEILGRLSNVDSAFGYPDIEGITNESTWFGNATASALASHFDDLDINLNAASPAPPDQATDNLLAREFAAFMIEPPRSRQALAEGMQSVPQSEGGDGFGWKEFWDLLTNPAMLTEVLLRLITWLIGLVLKILQTLFAYVIGGSFMMLLIFFPIVPLMALWPGKWVAGLNWARTVIWVGLWPAFFVLGGQIIAKSSLFFDVYQSQEVVGSLIGRLAMLMFGLMVVVSTPTTSSIIISAAGEGFGKVAMSAYGTMMKTFGAGAAIALAATGVGLAVAAKGAAVGGAVMAKGGGAMAAKGAAAGGKAGAVASQIGQASQKVGRGVQMAGQGVARNAHRGARGATNLVKSSAAYAESLHADAPGTVSGAMGQAQAVGGAYSAAGKHTAATLKLGAAQALSDEKLGLGDAINRGSSNIKGQLTSGGAQGEGTRVGRFIARNMGDATGMATGLTDSAGRIANDLSGGQGPGHYGSSIQNANRGIAGLKERSSTPGGQRQPMNAQEMLQVASAYAAVEAAAGDASETAGSKADKQTEATRRDIAGIGNAQLSGDSMKLRSVLKRAESTLVGNDAEMASALANNNVGDAAQMQMASGALMASMADAIDSVLTSGTVTDPETQRNLTGKRDEYRDIAGRRSVQAGENFMQLGPSGRMGMIGAAMEHDRNQQHRANADGESYSSGGGQLERLAGQFEAMGDGKSQAMAEAASMMLDQTAPDPQQRQQVLDNLRGNGLHAVADTMERGGTLMEVQEALKGSGQAGIMAGSSGFRTLDTFVPRPASGGGSVAYGGGGGGGSMASLPTGGGVSALPGGGGGVPALPGGGGGVPALPGGGDVPMLPPGGGFVMADSFSVAGEVSADSGHNVGGISDAREQMLLMDFRRNRNISELAKKHSLDPAQIRLVLQQHGML